MVAQCAALGRNAVDPSRPGGAMLVYATFAGELLEPREAARVYRALGGGTLEEARPAHAEQAFRDLEEERPVHAEHAFRDAGFRIKRKDVIGGESREYELELGEHSPRHGLYASRLMRKEDYFTQQLADRSTSKPLPTRSGCRSSCSASCCP